MKALNGALRINSFIEQKFIMHKRLFCLVLFVISQFGFAQYQIGLVPRVSPDRAVYQKIGYTEVNIKYGSPAVNNRILWGDLVPYDKVWRAGANNATTVEFSSAVSINGELLDSGKYAFFLIPRANADWTVIFNRAAKQWGAFKYNEKEDALRVAVAPHKVNDHTEHLTYSLEQEGYQKGSIVFNWGEVQLEVPFETNYAEAFEQEVESRAQQQPDYLQWVVYVQGAEHLQETGLNRDLAFEWINKAEAIMNSTSEWNEQFYPRDYVKGHLYWIKAQLLAEKSNYSEAISYAEQLKSLENTLFYMRVNKDGEMDSLVKTWLSK